MNPTIDDLSIISLVPSVGNEESKLSFEITVPIGFNNQMESNTPQDSATLVLQIQTLTASVEELARQNQEIRLQLQPKENRSPTRVGTNRNNDEDSHRRDDYQRLNSSDEVNSDLLRDIRKEMDELRNMVREKRTEIWTGWSEG